MPPQKPKPPPNMATLTLELLAQSKPGEAFVPPTEFRIFAPGKNESHKGTFYFTKESAKRVMATATKQKNDFSIDYNHGSFAFLSLDPAETSKAAGWFQPEIRGSEDAPELWATQVSWTPKATEKLSQREFRYISPAFDHAEKTGEVHMLKNVALTNTPALFDLEPLLASMSSGTTQQHEEPPPMKTLFAMLGLSDNATEAEVMAKLSLFQGVSTELLSVTSKANTSEALAVVKAWKVAAEGVPAMHAELSQLKTKATDDERATLIADGTKRGVVPPSYVPVLKTMELSQLKEFMKVAVPVHVPAAGDTGAGGTATTTLSQTEQDVAKLLGMTPEDLLKSKARHNGIVPVSGGAK